MLFRSDQILSVLKLGFYLLLRYVMVRFFGGITQEVNTLINQILLLPGTRTRTRTTETILFHGHRRNPEMMRLLRKACDSFNEIRHEQDGRIMRFELDWKDPLVERFQSSDPIPRSWYMSSIC